MPVDVRTLPIPFVILWFGILFSMLSLLLCYITDSMMHGRTSFTQQKPLNASLFYNRIFLRSSARTENHLFEYEIVYQTFNWYLNEIALQFQNWFAYSYPHNRVYKHALFNFGRTSTLHNLIWPYTTINLWKKFQFE